MKVRNYSDRDFQQAEELIRQSGMYNKLLDAPEFFRNNLKKKSEMDPDSIIVAEEHGKIIGIVIFVYDPLRCILLTIAVDKEHRNKGVGDILWQVTEQRIRARGAEEIIGLVPEQKSELLDLYRKYGGFAIDNVHYLLKKF